MRHFSKATALAIKGDRLVYVGGEAGVEAYIGPDTKVVDLGGETVIPGLVEGHMHVAGLGSGLMNLDCFWMPKQAIYGSSQGGRRTGKARGVDPGPRLDEHSMGGHQLPYKGGVGPVAPKQPSIPTRACGHMGWANSKGHRVGWDYPPIRQIPRAAST